jgi:adenine nucleotide transporter 17
VILNYRLEYAYFFFYSFVRNSYIKRLTNRLPPGSKVPPLSTAAELLLGAVAGALAQIFTIPVSVIATRQQIGRLPKQLALQIKAGNATPALEEESDDSFLSVAREIIEEEGVTGLWLGIKPGLVLTVNPAITYGIYERVKSLLLLAGSNTKLSPGASFLVGAFSKTLATIVSFTSLILKFSPSRFLHQVTYPYIMAKVRIQARSADIEEAIEEHHDLPAPHTYHHDKYKHAGALHILARVWRKEGFVGWYQVSALVNRFPFSAYLSG